MSIFHTKEVLHIQSVTLTVRDLTISTKFYTEILGFQIFKQDQHHVYLTANNKDVLITLVHNHAITLETHSLGLYHFALLLPNKAALAHIIQQLIHLKYPITGASDHGVSDALYLNDPDQNGIEIYVDNPVEDWPKVNNQIHMYTKHMNIPEIMSHLPKEPFKHIDANIVIGHLHLHVDDIQKAKHFFHTILGLGIVQYYGEQALFLSDQGYHHHLGLNTWNTSKQVRKDNESGLLAYDIFIPTTMKASFLKRLNDHHITIHSDDNQSYIFDPYLQRINLINL